MNTILVVEDNDDQWFLTRWALLRTWPGVQINRTASPSETLDYLNSCLTVNKALPILILLDLYMPRREDGWALLETFKQHSTLRRLPVVMLSYSDQPEDIQESYARLTTSYIVKPKSYPDWLTCFENFYRYWSTEVMQGLIRFAGPNVYRYTVTRPFIHRHRHLSADSYGIAVRSQKKPA